MSVQSFETCRSLPVSRWSGALENRLLDDVAEEVPVALEYNGISHAVMLASPADLEDFGLGFSLSEGVLRNSQELYSCDVTTGANGIRVAMQISNERFAGLKEKRRSLAGRTGCGLCGVESLAQVSKAPPTVDCPAAFDPLRLQQAFTQMQALQQLQQRTGSTHAAAWLAAEGPVRIIREDVGRHNALDKLIGRWRKAGPTSQKVLP